MKEGVSLMWIKNKKQETVWMIMDPKEIKRLLLEPDMYEEVQEPEIKETKKPEKTGK